MVKTLCGVASQIYEQPNAELHIFRGRLQPTGLTWKKVVRFFKRESAREHELIDQAIQKWKSEYEFPGERTVGKAFQRGRLEERKPALVRFTDEKGRTALFWVAKAPFGCSNIAQKQLGWTALMVAVRNGDQEAIEALLDSGADVNAKDKRGRTALMLAAGYGEVAAIRALLNNGADRRTRDYRGRTALMFASFNGNGTAIKALLTKGAAFDLKAEDHDGKTPLMLAASSNNPSAIKALLGAGADIHAENDAGYTALMVAAYNGHVEAIKALLGAGANIHDRNRGGQTALVIAACNGHVAAIKALEAAGAHLVGSGDDTTMIETAVRQCHTEVVKALLSKGACRNDMHWSDKRLWALGLAAGSGHAEVIEAVLAEGDRVNLGVGCGTSLVNFRDPFGQTALMIAACYSPPEAIEALVRAGAKLDVQDKKGQTALMFAARRGKRVATEALQLNYLAQGLSLSNVEKRVLKENEIPLLQPGAAWPDLVGQQEVDVLAEIKALLAKGGTDFEAQDRYGQTPLMRAAGHGYLEEAKALLDKGAKLDANDKDGQTPLMHAARGGHVTTLNVLLAYSAELDVQDNVGQTPLHIAALNNHVEAVAVLLGSGAAPDLKDEAGQTPLVVAATYDRPEMAELLQRSYQERGVSLSQEETQALSSLALGAPSGTASHDQEYSNRNGLARIVREADPAAVEESG